MCRREQSGKPQPTYAQKMAAAFFCFSRRDIAKQSRTKVASQSLTYNHCMESVLAAENRRRSEQVHKGQYIPASQLPSLGFVNHRMVLF